MSLYLWGLFIFMNKRIGFIGQGWIGKNYADDFEERGYDVTRYALEEPYVQNKGKIGECDIVFVAVPTPSTLDGFDDNIVRMAVKDVGEGKTVVLKSTMLPGTTEKIQAENPDIFVFHSPEFLVEASAAYDARNPNRNIVGVPEMNDEYKSRAQDVLDVLPKAPYEKICTAQEAELVKYAGNCFLYTKVLYINLLYDLATKLGGDWETIKECMTADPRIGDSHMDPIHKGARGAGGHCFIKDFAAFTEIYDNLVKDKHGLEILEALKNKNNKLLIDSEKDLDLLRGVYGEEVDSL